MRRTFSFCSALLLTTIGVRAFAQGNAPPKWADTISSEIEQAQIAADTPRLAAAVALATRASTAYPNDGLILHYQGYGIYRQGIIGLSTGADVVPLFEQAKALLERSLNTHPLAETHMLLSMIDGRLIASDPSRGMELGLASQMATREALKLGPMNPRVWLLRGEGSFFTPAEYGGGLPAAEEQLKRAIDLFAKDSPKPGEPSWGKAEAYVWLGQVYEKQGDKAKAAESYRTAVELSPKYSYARMLLGALK
jgi:tetratricopeptide (TPR) repeat protein